jgi:hypothetical protein
MKAGAANEVVRNAEETRFLRRAVGDGSEVVRLTAGKVSGIGTMQWKWRERWLAEVVRLTEGVGGGAGEGDSEFGDRWNER